MLFRNQRPEGKYALDIKTGWVSEFREVIKSGFNKISRRVGFQSSEQSSSPVSKRVGRVLLEEQDFVSV